MKKITAITALTAVLLTAATATAAEGTLYEAERTGEAVTAAVQFTDVNGSEWYAALLEKPVGFGVINGYEDGSFKADNQITAAEVATIFASTFENGVREKYSYSGTSHWAAPFFAASSKALPYTMAEATESSYADRPMTRAEVAYMAAKYISGNTGELEQYIQKANTGDVGSIASFADAQNIATDDNGTRDQDIKIINLGYIPSRLAGALSYCIDKGVFTGYEDSTIHPLNTITRGEMLSVLQKMCQETPSYTDGQFAYDASQQQQPTQTEVSRPTTTTHQKGESYGNQTPITWEEQNNRQPTTLRYDDPSRPTAIEGDIFIAPDGNSYELHRGKAGILGEDLIMQGVKLAIDLGRVDPNDSSEVITNNFQSKTYAFGWVDSIVRTTGCTYVVRNGVGLWDAQWSYIETNYAPTYNGTTDGEKDSTGFFEWDSVIEMWFLVNQD